MRRIHPAAYPNHPRVGVGAVVFREGKVLLIFRGKPPAQHTWAIPGGSVNLGETLQQAAEREVQEETGVIITAREPIFTFDAIVRDETDQVQFHYVVVDLAADYVSGEPTPGDDALDARWVSSDEMEGLRMNEMTGKLLKAVSCKL